MNEVSTSHTIAAGPAVYSSRVPLTCLLKIERRRIIINEVSTSNTLAAASEGTKGG
jgi:hypothetical protein